MANLCFTDNKRLWNWGIGVSLILFVSYIKGTVVKAMIMKVRSILELKKNLLSILQTIEEDIKIIHIKFWCPYN